MGLTNMVMITRRHESGAVSLFLVIFAMLLITVVTLSFIRLTLNDQQQASASDLSQSAYDSALAGTEDAKRALIYYRTVCATGDAAKCSEAEANLNSADCNIGLTNVVDSIVPNKEVQVQQSQAGNTNDKALNQAYTCVKMKLQNNDYLGSVAANTSKLIPLKSTTPFTTVKIEWYTAEDLGGINKTVNLLRYENAQTSQPLYTQANWVASRPSLMRTQLMQFGSSFTLDQFDSSNITHSNANTIFLYPTGNTGTASSITDNLVLAEKDIRKTPTGSPKPVHCSGNLSGGGYACSVTLILPQAIGASDNNRTAYLRLTPLYNGAHFRISLGGGALLDGVQPSIDSTGRANDQYRRVESRVDLQDTNFPFPEAAVDLTGNLCKDFLVTDQAADFKNSCTP